MASPFWIRPSATFWRALLHKIGVVVGLSAEARLAKALGLVAAGGGTPAGAENAAKSLVSQGITALLSFGLAGGLDPALRPGDVVVPRAVLCKGQIFPTDALYPTNADLLLAGDRILASTAEKRAARQASGAVAIDLESGAVAKIASEAGIGFAVIRAICDPAERDLPPAALIALDPAGKIGFLRVLASIAANPSQLPAVLRLAADAKAARKALIAFCEHSIS